VSAESNQNVGGYGEWRDGPDEKAWLQRALEALREGLASAGEARRASQASLAIVTGSGLGAIAEAGIERAVIPYAAIPGLAGGAVAGHEGCWRLIEIAGSLVHVLCGRRHLYEGIEPAQAGLAMRLLERLGVKRVLLTNAAGGLAPRLRVGDLMLIADHLNLMLRNPARGASGPATTPRGHVYDTAMNEALRVAAREAGLALEEGIYAAVLGPNFETRAEVAMLQRLGAAAVGMSTVPEALTARALGMRVAAISLITNTHVASAKPSSHEEVLEAGRRAVPRLVDLIRCAMPLLVDAH
jgi:purine-nucleoside phosphorylase